MCITIHEVLCSTPTTRKRGSKEGEREEGTRRKGNFKCQRPYLVFLRHTLNSCPALSKAYSTSIIFFRICRNRRVKASDFFFKRFRPVCAPFNRAFMMVWALRKQSKHIYCHHLKGTRNTSIADLCAVFWKQRHECAHSNAKNSSSEDWQKLEMAFFRKWGLGKT